MKIKDLRLALAAAPKKTDVRYYLNTVKVAVDHIAASNGHLLCHIKAGDSFNAIPEQLDNNGFQIPNAFILIPIETVKDFIKKVGTKSDEQTCFIKTTDCDGLTFHVLTGAGVQCLFTPVDAKYPSFDKIINNINDFKLGGPSPHISHQFDWQYIALADKALSSYSESKIGHSLYTLPIESSTQCGFFDFENCIFVIMPMKRA